MSKFIDIFIHKYTFTTFIVILYDVSSVIHLEFYLGLNYSIHLGFIQMTIQLSKPFIRISYLARCSSTSSTWEAKAGDFC